MGSATLSGVSNLVCGEVEHAEDDRLVRQRVQHVEREAGLRGLDADRVALGRRSGSARRLRYRFRVRAEACPIETSRGHHSLR
jgi:hypothetical protein